MAESYSSLSGEMTTRDSLENTWKFQADLLRAECNVLRMERKVAIKKLGSNRDQMGSALKSFMETIVSGRKKIDGMCGNEEIAELAFSSKVSDTEFISPEVEKLRMKMEGLSKGMMERMEEQGLFSAGRGGESYRLYGKKVGEVGDRRLTVHQMAKSGALNLAVGVGGKIKKEEVKPAVEKLLETGVFIVLDPSFLCCLPKKLGKLVDDKELFIFREFLL